MSIYVGVESNSAISGLIPIGLFHYVVPKMEINKATYLGFVDTIQSVTYNPFLDIHDIETVIESPFDTTRYGTPSLGIPQCYAIRSTDVIEKKLYERDIYTNKYINKGTPTIEPKLLTFPYRYFIINDGFNAPFMIQPQLIKNTNKLTVKVRTIPVSQQSKYNMFVEGYKNDFNGRLEGFVNTQSCMLPVTSSMYSQYMATSSASYNANFNNQLLENDLTLHQSNRNAILGFDTNNMQNSLNTDINLMNNSLGLIANVLTGNVGGVVGNLTSGINGLRQSNLNSTINGMNLANSLTNSKERYNLNEFEITANKNAKMRDLLNTPNTIKTSGNDTIFNMMNNDEKITITEYRINYKAQERLYHYFLRYGYRCNKFDNLSKVMNTRKYYNYVKTNICNIHSDIVPKEDLEEIKAIFNKGITIWHIDNGAYPLKYTLKGDNEEIYE